MVLYFFRRKSKSLVSFGHSDYMTHIGGLLGGTDMCKVLMGALSNTQSMGNWCTR